MAIRVMLVDDQVLLRTGFRMVLAYETVSYTHLTLPTICSV